MQSKGKIIRITGPLVEAKGLPSAKIYEIVKVGEEELVGEVIKLQGGKIFIQVYEDTTGLRPGEPVIGTSQPLSVELGPGLIESIFDGIQRPLEKIRAKVGDFIVRGVSIPALDRKKKWHFVPNLKKGEEVSGGDIVGVVEETSVIQHKIMLPPGVKGKLIEIREGKYTVEESYGVIKTREGEKQLCMLTTWPVKKPRPIGRKLDPSSPLLSGQRVIDTFFPMAKGGTACIPGPFGAGKTVMQHQLAKWADADVIVYVGCGERGNEMTEVLQDFPRLQDPRTGKPLLERTILIANTSNMPVAAREASVYTGITLAEYYRDMGYDTAVMADSTSRWAEAMREMSSRLEEMPGEEGYPAYLGSRLAQFYERAGRVICLGKPEREASLSVIGAVSPPGGDFSEPVTQNTLRITRVFWGLDARLADRRHFPAINWLTSYSLYASKLEPWLKKNVGEEFINLRKEALHLLQRESELQEIVQLVGAEALPESEQLVLAVAKMIREDFLQQDAYHKVDSYCSLSKQYGMLSLIIEFYRKAAQRLEKGVKLETILRSPIIPEIARLKFIPEKEFENKINSLREKLEKEKER